MANFTRRILGSIGSQVRTYVQWLLDRLFKPSQVYPAVKEKIPEAKPKMIAEEIQFHQEQKQAAQNFGTAFPNSPTISLGVPSVGSNPSITRYHVKFKFNNPKTGEVENRGYSIDLPNDLTKRHAQQKIRNAIVNDILANAQSIGKVEGKLNDLVGRITVVRIEAL